jgi:PelA/Pel-15E family pectate lyase
MKNQISGVLWLIAYLTISISIFNTGSIKAQSSEAGVSWHDIFEQKEDWYKTEKAIQIADNVILYQHYNGGWPKNLDMARELSEEEKKRLLKEKKDDKNTTIDNGATLTPLRYLARVFKSTGLPRFEHSFIEGLKYVLEAQYENGGWPQYYPLREGYYSHITFNDGAMIGVMQFLREVSQAKDEFSFVNKELRNRSAKAIEKGLEIILKTQIKVDGVLTAWCAQYDEKTLNPKKARSYELVSLSGGESVGIVRYLMNIENPGTEVVESIESAIQWFEKVKLTDIRLLQIEKPDLPKGYDRVIAFVPNGEKPMWARFYEIGTNYPMFVDRSGTVHYAFSELPYERRVGYSWLGSWPHKLIEKDYPKWKERIVESKNIK